MKKLYMVFYMAYISEDSKCFPSDVFIKSTSALV